jgi:DNA-binding SARP family transcriptional activator
MVREHRDLVRSRIWLPLVRRVLAGLVLLTVVAALPMGLLMVAGPPLPSRLPTLDEVTGTLSRPDDGTLLLGFLRLVAWLAWTGFVFLVLLEAVSRIRGRPTPQIPGLAGPQRIAAVLIAGVAALAVGTSAPLARAYALPPISNSPTAAAPPNPQSAASSETRDVPHQHAHPRRHHSVVVRPGDTLWGLAEKYLGDGSRYREIAELNYSRPQPDGQRLTDAHWIRPGWRLHLPAHAKVIPAPSEPHHQHPAHPPPTPRKHPSAPASKSPVPTPSESSPPPETSTPSQEPTDPGQTTAPTTPTTIVPSAHQPDGAIRLPSGAIVGLSFASGVATALFVSALHRRRRQRYSPDEFPSAEPEPPALAPPLTLLQRADLQRREEGGSDPAQLDSRSPVLHLFPLRSNGLVPIGIREGAEVTAPISGLAAGLSGPGASAALRALALTLITHAGDHDIELVVAIRDAAELFGLNIADLKAAADRIPALYLTRDLDAAVRQLESERVHRARLLDAEEEPVDLAQIRSSQPDEPLPYVVLLAHAVESQRHRVATLCDAAREYDMAVLTLDACPNGTNVDVAENGEVGTVSGPAADTWQHTTLFHITTGDAAQFLTTIGEAHGAEAPESKNDAGPAERAAQTERRAPPTQDARIHRPARLRVLGTPGLIVDGNELTVGIRRKAWELLTYLAVHPHGTARDTLLEIVYSDVDQERSIMRFHAALNDIRTALRDATDRSKEDFITAARQGYRIDPDLIEVDLWAFQAALDSAATTEPAEQQADLLEEAMSVYQGDLAADESYDWVEPERQALRRQAVHALTVVADRRRDQPERALMALERAIQIDPYAEDMYRKIMVLQAELEGRDGIRRTFRQLESRLEELNADPDEETEQLLRKLTRPRPTRS